MSSLSSAAYVANPHALEAIVAAGDSGTIVASQDIVNDRGQKLWAAGAPISRSLQARLLEHKLRQPLETCLRAEDGVAMPSVLLALRAFLDSAHPLAGPLKPWADKLVSEATVLPLHPVPQVLLTAARAIKPQMIDHAVQAMALAGAMALAAGTKGYEVKLALLAGLLHDIGEIYINPSYLTPSAALTAKDYRHIVVHPSVGQMLLQTQTDYPPQVARAVGEHHERLDGTGYPARLGTAALSPLGAQLAVVETLLGIAAHSPSPWVHAGFAMRLISSEFDRSGVGFIIRAAQTVAEDTGFAARGSIDEVRLELASIETRLSVAKTVSTDVLRAAQGTPAEPVAQRADQLITRLHLSWNAMGLWSAAWEDLSAEALFELHMARRELTYRLRDVRRESLWPEPDPSVSEQAAPLQPLWAALADHAA